MTLVLKNWTRRATHLLVGALWLGAVAAGQAAPVFSQMIVFGDSLSDTGNTRASIPGGNLPPINNIAGYGSNGRFSNGLVWHETLAPALNVPIPTASLVLGPNNSNYAYGGARINNASGQSAGLLFQYNRYATGAGIGGADPNALYAVWGGGNDMRDLVGNANPVTGIASALGALEGLLQNLIGLGAKTFLVPNLPDLGMIPEHRDSVRQASATQVSEAWNAGLLDMLLGLSDQADIYFLDVFSTFNDLLTNPAQYGFVNTTGQCRSLGFLALTENSCANADTWVFWDAIHPTRAAHALLGREAISVMNGSPLFNVPEPATAWLALLAVGLALRTGRVWRLPAPAPRH